MKPVQNLARNIPVLSIPDVPLTDTTQAQLPIANIRDDVILFKDGSAAIILESTSLNFGLLSENEQEAVIIAYAGLMNSLSFSIQIMVRTIRKDISSYVAYLEEAQTKIQNPKLAELMESYKKFITETIKKKNVLGKRFFIVVPFSSLELGVKSSFKSLTRKSKGPLPFEEDYVLKKAKITLNPRRDHLMRQAGRLGLKLNQLDTKQIQALMYDVFNPQPPTTKEEEVVL
jgi:hypothetical protein